MVISNNSGCGGAALSRRRIGETIEVINTAFPHWFCGNFHAYNGREDSLPVDQHMLLALIAPRPTYLGSAEGDLCAESNGEMISRPRAGELYRPFGDDGVAQMPLVDRPVLKGHMRHHNRTGKHEIRAYHWEKYKPVAEDV